MAKRVDGHFEAPARAGSARTSRAACKVPSAHQGPPPRAHGSTLAAALGAVLALPGTGCGGRTTPASASPYAIDVRSAPCPSALSTSSIADEKLIVRARCLFYEVRGHSADALRRSLNSEGPTDETGTYDAYTSFALRYGFDEKRDAAGCRTTSVVVELHLAHILPEWLQAKTAPRALTTRWLHFTERLAAHERGHADISIAAARELTRDLEGLPPQPTCGTLRSLAHRLFEEAIGRLGHSHRSYDWRTHHGRRQGVRFP
ncbi:DUF922 domain-containing Zn-dependent protease [Chondromyces crocatus]|uniref:DUF922 domain-containing protein n=1 Tax=Chondromyces crocatus TaxID=52 RepID=A0A0K1ETA1_CHOCO|nr:DUF922 domain-containing protein [Chondromyces crocatus]AKT44145.1 uncharacterized protein CMC5_083850 [Chondromyces crocatus]